MCELIDEAAHEVFAYLALNHLMMIRMVMTDLHRSITHQSPTLLIIV
jgi:hypothetical protein